MAHKVNRWWNFVRGQYATPDLGAAVATPIEKPLVPYDARGAGRAYHPTHAFQAPFYAAPNLIVVGLGGLQQGQLTAPGPLYQGPGQTFTHDSAALG